MLENHTNVCVASVSFEKIFSRLRLKRAAKLKNKLEIQSHSHISISSRTKHCRDDELLCVWARICLMQFLMMRYLTLHHDAGRPAGCAFCEKCQIQKRRIPANVINYSKRTDR